MEIFDNIVYLDHNATTYILPEVFEAMKPYLTNVFFNPSSIYRPSEELHEVLEEARDKIKELLGAKQGKVVFTGGGSESDNLALKGIAYAKQNKGKHIITSQIEHHAVLHTCENLEKHGFEITYLPVDKIGLVNLDALKKAIRKETILISIMYANNETGVIQPIEEIAKIAHENGILFHTDAVQVVGKIPVNVEQSGIDLLSLSAHKFYGPKGVGALYINKGVTIEPQIHGGGQEMKLRAGTENIAGIMGMVKALELASTNAVEESKKEKALRDRLQAGITKLIPECFINGYDSAKKDVRLNNTLNVIIKYIEGESMLLLMDAQKICISSGSACTSGSLDPSHVLLAMGIPHEFAHGSLRFSFGRYNTDSDVDKVLEVLPGIVSRLRKMSPLYEGKE